MMISCTEFENALIELAYNEVADDYAELLRDHAANCQHCRKSLEDMLLTRRLAGQLPSLSYDEPMNSKIIEAIDALPSNEPKGIQGWTPTRQHHRLEPTRSSTITRIRSWLLTPAFATSLIGGVVLVASLSF